MSIARGRAPERSLLTLAQACDYLQLSDKTLRGIIAEGKLAASKVGTTWRIRSDSIDAYLEANRFIPTSRAGPKPSSVSGGENSWDRIFREDRAARKRGR